MASLRGIIGREIWFYPHLPRAMELAKELVLKYPRTAHGRIIVSQELTQAKGRFSRKWYAEKGGLWLALSLYDELLPQHSSLLTLLFGIAMVRTTHQLGAKMVRLKWISDPHYQGKKLGGILLERYQDWFIIGLGMNVNNPPPPSIPAINLKELLGKEVSLVKVLEELIFWMNFYYEDLLVYEKAFLAEEERECAILNDFYRFSDSLGQCVAFAYNLDQDEPIIGKVVGVTETGSLLLETPEGLLEFNAGEIIYL